MSYVYKFKHIYLAEFQHDQPQMEVADATQPFANFKVSFLSLPNLRVLEYIVFTVISGQLPNG